MANVQPTERHEEIQFRQLFEEAVSKPGTLMQANRRGIPLGPIASFNRWKELGRHVQRGEKAIELCMPVTCKRSVKEEGPDGNEIESEIAFKRFVFRRHWFMLAQTDGAPFVMPMVPAWDRA